MTSGGRVGATVTSRFLVAVGSRVYGVDLAAGVEAVAGAEPAAGVPTNGVVAWAAGGIESRRPSCLVAFAGSGGIAWCGTEDAGVYRSVDGGRTWSRAGLETEKVTALAADLRDPNVAWAGTEPSALWRTGDAGGTWERTEGMEDLPSASDWSFPPRPETHHVRWITQHPVNPERLWIAIEAGALVSTSDAGRSWRDRVAGGPYDTHELAVHPSAPDRLHSAAGDGYYLSSDAGRSWTSPEAGLEVGYLRSVAIDPVDPTVVVVSAASHPHRAYVAGRADGRLYRREGNGSWERVRTGWPDPPATIAPLLVADAATRSLLAADERGIHRSRDAGRSWERIAAYPESVDLLRGLAVVPAISAPGDP